MMYMDSIRYSYFMASQMLPHFVVLYAGTAAASGTLGTQAAPPGTTTSVSTMPAPTRVGSPAAVRDVLMRAAAAVYPGAPPVRMFPSAARRRSTGATKMG